MFARLCWVKGNNRSLLLAVICVALKRKLNISALIGTRHMRIDFFTSIQTFSGCNAWLEMPPGGWNWHTFTQKVIIDGIRKEINIGWNVFRYRRTSRREERCCISDLSQIVMEFNSVKRLSYSRQCITMYIKWCCL